MRKRPLILTLSLAALTLTCVLTFARLGSSKPTLEVIPHGTTWPNNNAWTFNAALPADLPKDVMFTVVFRFKSFTLPEKTSLAVHGAASPLTETEATERFECGGQVMTDKSAPAILTVDIQLLDLSQIGAVSAKPGQDLRLLAALRASGSDISGCMNLSGDRIFLPAGSIAGWTTRPEAEWRDNELHLMNFYIRSGQTGYQYDAVLQVKANPNP